MCENQGTYKQSHFSNMHVKRATSECKLSVSINRYRPVHKHIQMKYVRDYEQHIVRLSDINARQKSKKRHQTNFMA